MYFISLSMYQFKTNKADYLTIGLGSLTNAVFLCTLTMNHTFFDVQQVWYVSMLRLLQPILERMS